MIPLSFTKMEGCGNDFLVLDCLGQDRILFTEAQVRYLCHRQFGLGADGLIVLRGDSFAHGAWDFFNSDGSVAEMCGNGARCAVLYLKQKHFPEADTILLKTLPRMIEGRVFDGDQVELTFLEPEFNQIQFTEHSIALGDTPAQVYRINTGVPHAVLEIKDIASYPIAKWGRHIQQMAMFQPAGTNVTFFQKNGSRKILSTTFERGVEAQTYACGTGAVAAALVYRELYLEKWPIEVEVPGGTLHVDECPRSKKILLIGPAHTVGTFFINGIAEKLAEHRLFGRNTLS